MRFFSGNGRGLGSALLLGLLGTSACNVIFGVNGGIGTGSSGSGASAGTGATGGSSTGTGAGGASTSGGSAGDGSISSSGTTTSSGGGGTGGTGGTGGSGACAADGNATKWVAHPIGNYLDEGLAAAYQPGGDAVVAGYYFDDDFVVKSLPALPRSGPDDRENVFVARYSKGVGGAVWAKGFAGENVQKVTGMGVDPKDGSPIVAGYFLGSFTVGGTMLTADATYSVDAGEGFVLKLDPDTGEPAWARKLGSASTDVITSMAVDSAGNTLVTGASAIIGDASPPDMMPVDFGCGPRTLDKAAPWVFLVKLDPSGKCVWDKEYVMDTRFGGVGSRIGLAVAVDAKDNVLLAGGFAGVADFGVVQIQATGNKDAFVAKLGSDGTVMWAQSYGDGNYQIATLVAADPMGDIWLGGSFTNSVTLGNLPIQLDPKADAQHNKAWIAKLSVNAAKPDQAAKPVYLRLLTDAGEVALTSLSVAPDGDPVFGGVASPTDVPEGIDFGDGKKLMPAEKNVDGTYRNDGFVARYCSDGGLRWVRQIATAGNEYVNGVATDASGSTLVTGSFEGVYDFGGPKSIMSYGLDVFALDMGPK